MRQPKIHFKRIAPHTRTPPAPKEYSFLQRVRAAEQQLPPNLQALDELTVTEEFTQGKTVQDLIKHPARL